MAATSKLDASIWLEVVGARALASEESARWVWFRVLGAGVYGHEKGRHSYSCARNCSANKKPVSIYTRNERLVEGPIITGRPDVLLALLPHASWWRRKEQNVTPDNKFAFLSCDPQV